MEQTFKLTNRDTMLEARYTGEDTVQVRYLAPCVSDWIAEEYHLSTLHAAGLVRVEGGAA
jgi:hypothetical protein